MSTLSSGLDSRRLQWCGGVGGLVFLLVTQSLLVLLMVLDWKLAVAAVFACAVVTTILDRPTLAVGLLVAARLLDTSSNAFLQIGRINVGMFEVILLLALIALMVGVVRHQRALFHTWPWRTPLLAFMVWQVISLAWSVDKAEGIKEIISMGVVLATTTIIVTYVRNPRVFTFVLWMWIAACVLIGVLTLFTGMMGFEDSDPWEAASGGGRETGLGQQPNWYAMNLMFIVHTTFGLALAQRRRLLRYLLVAIGIFIFFNMMRSGSRGGTYSIIIGGALTALALPMFRKWFIRFLVVVLLLFAATTTMDWGSTSQAFLRIYENLDHTWSHVRGLNWKACIDMFTHTWGRGIGAGGYVDMLSRYNWHLYESVYRYPHGIVWGLTAHYGVIGLAIMGWLAVQVIRMGQRLVRESRGSMLEIFAWTMPATIFGYLAWSFVEFEYNEKPFWEFLALYTALALMVHRARKEGVPLPELPGGLSLPWRRTPAAVSTRAAPRYQALAGPQEAPGSPSTPDHRSHPLTSPEPAIRRKDPTGPRPRVDSATGLEGRARSDSTPKRRT